MAKKCGVTVKDMYWTLGAYDVVAICEAPDDEAATALSLSVCSRGNIRSQTLRAFLSLPKIISGRIGGAVQPGWEWRGWRQSVGPLDARVHLSVMPSACALDCNTPHRRKEFAAGASR